MSPRDGGRADLLLLQMYFDGELGGLRKWLFERRLARSSVLRDRLRMLEHDSAWIREAAMAGEPETGPDLWPGLASDLAAIDREIDDRPGAFIGRWRAMLQPTPAWSGLAAAALLALLVLSSFGGLIEGGFDGWMEQQAGTSPDGALRYLNTDGRPVLVSQDGEGTTIIWLMDLPAGSV